MNWVSDSKKQTPDIERSVANWFSGAEKGVVVDLILIPKRN